MDPINNMQKLAETKKKYHLVMAPSMEWKQKSRAPAPRPNPQCHQEDQDSLAQRLMKSGSCTQIRRPCARRRDVAAKLVVAVIDAGCLASSASKSTLSPARAASWSGGEKRNKDRIQIRGVGGRRPNSSAPLSMRSGEKEARDGRGRWPAV